MHEEYNFDPKNLDNNTKQDSIILNIQRACEAVIGLSMHIIAEKRLGIPQTSIEAFQILRTNQIISDEVLKKMKVIVEFRDTIIHNDLINKSGVQKLIESDLDYLKNFYIEINVYHTNY